MSVENIQRALGNKFNEDKRDGANRHVVFWYDDDGIFKDDIDALDLEDVKLVKLEDNYFAIKHLLEEQDLDSNYLIYSTQPKPKNEDNWLLDINLYGAEFSADRASMIMNDVGIDDPSLKPFIKKYAMFFNSKKRSDSLKAMKDVAWSEEQYKLGMLAVLTKQSQPSIECITRALLLEGFGENDLMDDIDKYLDQEYLWEFIAKEYGYQSEAPTLKFLFWSLGLTYLSVSTKFEIPKDWQVYVSRAKNNCFVFVDHWMNHARDCVQFDKYVQDLEDELYVKEKISGWSIEEYIESDAFSIFDKALILSIVDLLKKGGEDFDRYLDYIKLRLTKHWAASFEDMYKALEYTIMMFKFKKEHSDEFPAKSAKEYFDLYVTSYFRVDQYYRLFYMHFDRVQNDVLKKDIRQIVENNYSNWFLSGLSIQWLSALKEELVDRWEIDGIQQQKDFFNDVIADGLKKSDRAKVFVFISDALRFEIAQQLKEELVSSRTGSVELQSMLGVLPSYTKLGMASLLPGESIEIDDKARVLVDGKGTAGIEDRENILKSKESSSVAVKWNVLSAMSREEARNLIKGARVVYIYHDVIDSVGDQAKTELKTFEAVEKALVEIKDAINRICNELWGTRIYITADHGFIYKRDPLEESDKLKKEEIKVIDSSRRFMLTDHREEIDGALTFNLTSLLDKEYYAIVPNGNMRFKVQGGGANFVHGGASLQEIVVPLLEYKHVRPKNLDEDQKPRPVEVELTNVNRVISNNIFVLNFFQAEKVGGRITPRRIKVAVWDSENNKISDENLFIADSVSDKASERQFKITLRLKKGDYDKEKDYYLKLIDDESGIEYKNEKFKINIMISRDFDDF